MVKLIRLLSLPLTISIFISQLTFAHEIKSLKDLKNHSDFVFEGEIIRSTIADNNCKEIIPRKKNGMAVAL